LVTYRAHATTAFRVKEVVVSGRVIVVGGINTDLVVRSKTLPRPGETILGGDFSIVGGGKGANAAVAAARLGASVALVACVGDDDFGRARLADLVREGIDAGGVRAVAGVPSGVALIVVDAQGENTIVVVPGANAQLEAETIVALAPVAGDVLLGQLEIPFATTAAALRRARAAGATTVLNAAPYDPACLAMLPLLDLLIVNEVEAADLLGWPQITLATAADAVAALQARGPGAVAITLGAHGAIVGRGDRRQHFPAPQVTVIDTTAAGDAFCGALAAGLASGDDLFAAAARDDGAGGLAITQAGAQPSLPRREAVELAMRRGGE